MNLKILLGSLASTIIIGFLLLLFRPTMPCSHTSTMFYVPDSIPTTGHFCGYDDVYSKMSKQEIQLQNQLEQQLYSLLQKGSYASGLKALYTIPVVVHVVHNNGPGNIPNAQATAAIQHLNDAFANIGVYNPSTGVDVEVQFCLAQRDPLGNATNGITNTVSTLTNLNSNTQDLALKNLIRWNPLDYVNIWVVNNIQGGVAGYAYLPSSHGNNNDGIVLEANYMGTTTDNSKVLVHEMGHYLGLLHTFEGGCINNDCLQDNDKVCDTPPDNTTVWVPCNAATNSCATDDDDLSANNPYRPLANGGLGDQLDQKENYMDYSDLVCYDRFSQGQKVRMQFFLTGIRASLLNSLGCLSPCLNPTVASFNASATNIAAGTLVNFSNSSTGATNYEWYNNGVLFSTTTNSSQTFNTPGNYQIILIALNGDPNCTTTDTINVTVTCTAQALFTSSVNQVAPGNVVYFINNSLGATTYEWFVNNVSTATSFNFNYSFPTIGTYDVSLVVSDGICTDTSATIVITVVPNALPQTGLPIWPLAVAGNVNGQVVDWRDTTPVVGNIPNTSTNGGQTGAAFNQCGQLAFYVLHTGSVNQNELFIYEPDGTPLLTNATTNAPGLNAVKGGQELQVVKVPQTTDEWYIIYKEWSSSVGAPAGNASYRESNWRYSRVQYSGIGPLTVVQRDIPLADALGVSHTYTDGAAVSRTTASSNTNHYLYLCRRTINVNNVSLDRFIISNTGISWDANTGNIPANWWSLTIAGSPIELSPTEDRIAVVCRNQSLNFTDIVIVDASLFNAASAIPLSMGDLILQPDGTPNDQSSILNIAGAVDILAFNGTYPLGFLRNMEKKVSNIEFSPNGRFLYFANGGYTSSGTTFITYLGQIDLNQSPLELRLQCQTTPTPPNMTSGQGCLASTCGNLWRATGTIESCYDGNLYFTKRGASTLFVIPEPNGFMPQNLVPSNIDLSTATEPNISLLQGTTSALPDQIDGFNYLSTEYREVELVVSKLDCFGACDTMNYVLEVYDSSGATVESYVLGGNCPDTLIFCADTAQIYGLREVGGLNYPNAVFYGYPLCPNPECIFDFTNPGVCGNFVCDGSFFQTVDSAGFMILYDVDDNPVTFNHISNLTTNGLVSTINAIAYNPINNFIYGINNTIPYQLYRINTQGIASYLGNITGITGNNYAGCMDVNGVYYVTGAGGQLYTIDVNTLAATFVGNTGRVCADIAYNPNDGQIYGFDTNANRLFRVNPTTATAVNVGPVSTQYSFFGALYFNAQGDIVAYGDDATITTTGQESLVKIDPNTGLITTLGTGPGVGINDGCSCPFGVELTKEGPDTIIAGNTYTYTFKIYNQTGFVINNVVFSDILHDGALWASEPQNVFGVDISPTLITGTTDGVFVLDSIQTGVDSFTCATSKAH